jgi:hypothetical protein
VDVKEVIRSIGLPSLNSSGQGQVLAYERHANKPSGITKTANFLTSYYGLSENGAIPYRQSF